MGPFFFSLLTLGYFHLQCAGVLLGVAIEPGIFVRDGHLSCQRRRQAFVGLCEIIGIDLINQIKPTGHFRAGQYRSAQERMDQFRCLSINAQQFIRIIQPERATFGHQVFQRSARDLRNGFS